MSSPGKLNYTFGVRSTARALIREVRILFVHLCAVRTASSYPSSGLELNLGCGPKPKPEWINVDLASTADLRLDLRRRLPFRTCSCARVYTEHFLEHLDYPEPSTSFLKECCRVLQPGGVISIGVPDTEWPLEQYLSTESIDYFRLMKELMWHPSWCRTRMEHINYHFRQDGEHRFAYDFATLSSQMRSVGFSDVRRRPFSEGMDSHERRIGTLYVVATKAPA